MVNLQNSALNFYKRMNRHLYTTSNYKLIYKE